MKKLISDIPNRNWAIILFVAVILIGSGFSATGLTGGLIIAAIIVICLAAGIALGTQLRRTNR